MGIICRWHLKLKGDGSDIVLEGPGGLLIEHYLKFKFKGSNNQAEYEGFIIGMVFTIEIGSWNLKAKSH